MSADLDLVPLVLSIDLAGALTGRERASAYAAVRSGDIPVLPGPGRRKVPTAFIERLCGRPITAADIRAAEERIAPKRDALRQYQAEYRAARSANASRKAAV